MKPRYTARFLRSYASAPTHVRKAFDKQCALLLQSLQHPSLRAKKYDKRAGIWQGRVTRNWRFYFTIEADTYTFLDISPHPK